MPLGASIMKRFELSPQAFSLLVSAYTFTAGGSALISALYVDKLDRKHTLLVVLLGFMLGTLACGLAPNYWFLFAARCIAGAFGGLLGALILAIVGDLVAPEKRGRAMGLIMAAFSVASVVGLPIGLYLAKIFNWHIPFLLIAALCIPIWILSYFNIPKINAHLIKEKSSIWLVFKHVKYNKSQQRGLVFMVLLMLGQFTIIPFIAPYMELNIGISSANIPMIYFFGGLLTMFTSPIVGKITDKFGKNKTYTFFAILTLIPIYVITNLGKNSLWIVLIITTFFFVVSTGRMIPAQAMILGTVPPNIRGSFMSLNSAVQQAAAGVASIIGGTIINSNASGALLNYQYVGYFALAASIMAIAISQKLSGNY